MTQHFVTNQVVCSAIYARINETNRMQYFHNIGGLVLYILLSVF